MLFPFRSLLFGSIYTLISYQVQNNKEADLKEFLETQYENFDFEASLPKIKEYDFIIVGGGSAGLIILNKLSKDHTVLLLEAGGDPTWPTEIPAYFNELRQSKDIAFQWRSTKQKYSSLGVNNGHTDIEQGKFLSGTSGINAMQYNRGNPKDYDRWAETVGDESYTYENLLKYFKMTENFLYQHDNDHLGHEGSLPITQVKGTLSVEQLQWEENWMKAGDELGYKRRNNSNEPQREGFVEISENKVAGRRYSTYRAFLEPILSRETLTISKYSVAKKIHFDSNGKAEGILYEKHGINQYAKATKEIIISAGAMNSPLILMNSGIGPEEQLKAANIPVKINLPVAQNFVDHVMVIFGNIFIKNGPFDNVTEKDIKKYIKLGKPPLSQTMGIFTQAFIASSEAKKEKQEDYPDIQLVHGFLSRTLTDFNNMLNVAVILGRPTSVGNLTLNPENPSGPLIFNPNYLETERDINVLTEGLEIVSKLIQTKAFGENGAVIDKTPVEKCKFEWGTREYWTCIAREFSLSVWHPASTCPMGKEGDPKAVVDSKFIVKGVPNLRVIDNSIMPHITNANTLAPALMIGQKGSDMILEKYKSL